MGVTANDLTLHRVRRFKSSRLRHADPQGSVRRFFGIGTTEHAPVAQRIEHLTTDQEVRGSNPFGRTEEKPRTAAMRFGAFSMTSELSPARQRWSEFGASVLSSRCRTRCRGTQSNGVRGTVERSATVLGCVLVEKLCFFLGIASDLHSFDVSPLRLARHCRIADLAVQAGVVFLGRSFRNNLWSTEPGVMR